MIKLSENLLGNPLKCPLSMSKAEVITIMMLFHLSGYCCFKHFYPDQSKPHMKDDFSKTVSCNRFTELTGKSIMGWFHGFKLHLLRKRSLTETVNDEPKNIFQVEYSRYRSIINLVVTWPRAYWPIIPSPKNHH